LQTEAEKLKNVTMGYISTTVIAVGIGSGVDLNELKYMASTPHDRNVVVAHNFSSLTDVEEQLVNTSCGGLY